MHSGARCNSNRAWRWRASISASRCSICRICRRRKKSCKLRSRRANRAAAALPSRSRGQDPEQTGRSDRRVSKGAAHRSERRGRKRKPGTTLRTTAQVSGSDRSVAARHCRRAVQRHGALQSRNVVDAFGSKRRRQKVIAQFQELRQPRNWHDSRHELSRTGPVRRSDCVDWRRA